VDRKRITATAFALCCLLTTGGKIIPEKSITINGLWGRHPVTYRQAVKRMPFHILLPTAWKPRDCNYWTQLIRQEPGDLYHAGFPARPALAIQRKDDKTSLIIETQYIQSKSFDDNSRGMQRIIDYGYFIKEVPMGVEAFDHIQHTACKIVTTASSPDQANELDFSLR
jgi:hypothetical protein